MALLFQLLDCPSHRNHIVVGVRRKNQHLFLGGCSFSQRGQLDFLGVLWPVSKRPACDFTDYFFVAVKIEVFDGAIGDIDN